MMEYHAKMMVTLINQLARLFVKILSISVALSRVILKKKLTESRCVLQPVFLSKLVE